MPARSTTARRTRPGWPTTSIGRRRRPATSDHRDPPTGPTPVLDSALPKRLAPGRTRTPLLLAVIGVLVVALGVMTALWISASNQLSATASIRAATPDLIKVADRNLGDAAFFTGDSGSVSMVISKYGIAKAETGLRQMLDELGFSSAVLDPMGNTRALDGTRDAQGRFERHLDLPSRRRAADGVRGRAAELTPGGHRCRSGALMNPFGSSAEENAASSFGPTRCRSGCRRGGASG